ncbi:MAG TPA: hypothetical protein VFY10_12575 [Dehalococcoidia bacterium]|nr:hypothetical protein [Dehalococcoidia bacterium]
MVAGPRNIMPTDLLALVTSAGSSLENQAWPRERLGLAESQPTLNVVRDQLLAFGKQRSAWVSTRRQRLQGLAGARKRGGNTAWEIDYLVDSASDARICSGLLTHVVEAGGQQGVQKVFLRLESDAGLLRTAIESGFVPYQNESLYVLDGGLTLATRTTPEGLRPARPADGYPLFRLYNATTPETTRRYEAVTFAEWQAAQEKRWLRHGDQLVYEADGVLHGIVRCARHSQGLMLDVMLDTATTDCVQGVIEGAVSMLDAAREPILVLVPQSREWLARRLEDMGFEMRGSFTSLIQRTVRPIAVPKMTPAVAKHAIGV